MIDKVRNVFLLAAFSSVLGCSSESSPVDIGDSRTGEKLEDYAAVWEGYAEAYDFKDGSDKVKISLDALGHGTLEIGNSPALPIATNGDVGYPATYEATAQLASTDHSQIPTLFPGFSYPIATAAVEAARIRLSVNPWEIERDWCALQTSYPVQSGNETVYLCMPSLGGAIGATCIDSSSTPPVPMDCAKQDLCQQRVCSCDARGCAGRDAPPPLFSDAKLDAALDNAGASLVGTLKLVAGANGEPQTSITVRLQRVSND